MGSPDLFDILEGIRFIGKGTFKSLNRRDQSVFDGTQRRHMDHRRDHIVAGLSGINMIVGMDRGFAAPLTGENLIGPG